MCSNVNNNYFMISDNSVFLDKLDAGVYEVRESTQGLYLSKVYDKFTFDYKIYDINNDFMDKVIKYFSVSTGNTGVLLWGKQGTGKTIMSKLLSNRLGLPTIIVRSLRGENHNLVSFLNNIKQDCVILIDEFEKEFEENDPNVLKLLDGVHKIDYKRLFILTANKVNTINSNLFSRPSRIRYMLKFNRISENIIKDYLSDNLSDKSAVGKLVKFINRMEFCSIDIIQNIVEEVNIFGVDEFLRDKASFNVSIIGTKYKCIILDSAEVKTREYVLDDHNLKGDNEHPRSWMSSITIDGDLSDLVVGDELDDSDIISISGDKKFIITDHYGEFRHYLITGEIKRFDFYNDLVL